MNWINEAVFYHIFPMGFFDVPQKNDFYSKETTKLEKMNEWIPHIKNLGLNAVYFGPVFESTSHGYDTVDYYKIDRRLGTNQLFKNLVTNLHNNEINVVLDAVFNHTSRDFFAFKDLIKNGKNSVYKDWFHNINFNKRSPYRDNFSYEGWNGHYNLVKLNLKNQEVKNYLFQAVKMWIQEFNIDGLRLDAADCLDLEFLKELSVFCKNLKPDFWLMGEIIHGDYNVWANNHILDSVTNYECYKGLYSSHNDKNYFEIAYSFNRQFGNNGVYKNLLLYSFVDNHDVDRIASTLKDENHLYPLYCLLFTMPGIPSIYYGSEWAVSGKKSNYSDMPLRPSAETISKSSSHHLQHTIKQLSEIRKQSDGLKYGNYNPLFNNHQQIVFSRESKKEKVIVAVNSEDKEVNINLKLPYNGTLNDHLNNQTFEIKDGNLNFSVFPNWARIMTLSES